MQRDTVPAQGMNGIIEHQEKVPTDLDINRRSPSGFLSCAPARPLPEVLGCRHSHWLACRAQEGLPGMSPGTEPGQGQAYTDLVAEDFERHFPALTRHFQCREAALAGRDRAGPGRRRDARGLRGAGQGPWRGRQARGRAPGPAGAAGMRQGRRAEDPSAERRETRKPDTGAARLTGLFCLHLTGPAICPFGQPRVVPSCQGSPGEPSGLSHDGIVTPRTRRTAAPSRRDAQGLRRPAVARHRHHRGQAPQAPGRSGRARG